MRFDGKGCEEMILDCSNGNVIKYDVIVTDRKGHKDTMLFSDLKRAKQYFKEEVELARATNTALVVSLWNRKTHESEMHDFVNWEAK